MNSKVGNSLAIVSGIVCSAWRAILPGYLGSLIYRSLPHKNNLKLYKKLQKAEASLLLQTRTGRIGLASFLFRAGVSDFVTSLCMCGQAEETAKHITSSCSLY